ncbi:MAG: HD domain-containing protein [Fusobacteriaceae bacterium]|jgi:putative hydrolase of HD superfamily|nr:HD domain-containing protein [Fusobacteriaceae bacterium]
MNKIYEQLKFLTEIDKVKGILRQSVILGDTNHRENDAEHSWHMAMCAIVLKEYVDLDMVNMETVFKLILIHDIVEIYAGDVPAYSNYSEEEKFQKELEAAEKIFSLLPQEQSREFMKLWLEFEKMDTVEAKYAAVFDRFQGFIQNLTSDGHTWKKFSPQKEMVLKRMEPIRLYAPEIFEKIVLVKVNEYVDRGIIK